MMRRLARVRNDGGVDMSLPESGTLSDGSTVANYHLLPDDILHAEGWEPLVSAGSDYDPERLDADLYMVREDGAIVVNPDSGIVPHSPALKTDKTTIPADGVTFAEITYSHSYGPRPEGVVFRVNDEYADVSLDGGVASLRVVSDTSGPIEVAVDVLPGALITILALEV